MPIQCPRCKEINKDGAVFCNHCGWKFDVSQQTAHETPPDTKPDTEPVRTSPLKTNPVETVTPPAKNSFYIPPVQPTDRTGHDVIRNQNPPNTPQKVWWKWPLIIVIDFILLICFSTIPYIGIYIGWVLVIGSNWYIYAEGSRQDTRIPEAIAGKTSQNTDKSPETTGNTSQNPMADALFSKLRRRYTIKQGLKWFGIIVIGIFLFLITLLAPASAIFFLPYIYCIYRFTRVKSYYGFVKNLHGSKDPSPWDWEFDLKQLDARQEIKRDYLGRSFSLPVVNVIYNTGMVHGGDIMEGAEVFVVGKKSFQKVLAKEIWNLSIDYHTVSSNQAAEIFGRITDFNSVTIPDVRYPDGSRTLTEWSFKLQETDEKFEELLRDSSGNWSPPVQVKIAARKISPPLRDNDKVKLAGWYENTVFIANYVCDISAGGVEIEIIGMEGRM